MITQEEIPPFTKEECKAMIKTIYQHRKEKKDLLNKVCEWVKKHYMEYAHNSIGSECIIKDLRRAMDE